MYGRHREVVKGVSFGLDTLETRRYRCLFIWAVLVTDDGKCDTDVRRTLGIAEDAFRKISNALRHRHISL